MKYLEKIRLDDKEIEIDMSYRNDLNITVKFMDQNGIEHKRTFLFRVFGEKPTQLTVEARSKLLYKTSSDNVE